MSSRRSGNTDFRDTVASFLRTTLDQLSTQVGPQVSAVREAATRQAQISKERLDDVWLGRRRREILVQLGEQVLNRIEHYPGLADEDSIAALIAELDQLETDPAAAPESNDEKPARWQASRRSSGSQGKETVEDTDEPPHTVRVWRPDRDLSATPSSIGFRRSAELEGDDLEAFMHPDDVPEHGADPE